MNDIVPQVPLLDLPQHLCGPVEIAPPQSPPADPYATDMSNLEAEK